MSVKITIEEIENGEEEIIVRCHEINQDLIKFLEQLNRLKKGLTGWIGEEIHRVSLSDIFYFEVVDHRSFLYCEKEVYETKMKLYEFEELCENTGFFRAGKSLVINSDKIECIIPSFSGRFEVKLINGEKRIVSRLYVNELKKKLGV